MPIRNEIFGVYKTLLINGEYVLAEDASRNRVMEAEPKAYIQGTPKTRVLNIGGVREEINLKMPILVGRGSTLDGRNFMVDQIANALQPENASLPLLTSAKISVSEQGAEIGINLLTDGNPDSAPVFDVQGNAPGTGTPSDRLDPLLSPAPTRVARFFDFRVNLAGYTYFVQEASISVDVDTQKLYFIAGKPSGSVPGDPPVPDPNPNNWGTQFPTIGVTGVRVSGTGKACVLLEDLTGDYDFDDYGQPDVYTPGGESLNVSLGGGTTELTLQTPGATVTVASDFALEIYNPYSALGTVGWQSIFDDGTGTSVVDLSRSVVTRANFHVSPQVLTVDFDFICYVK